MTQKLRNTASLRLKASLMKNCIRWDGYRFEPLIREIDPDELKSYKASLNNKGQVVFEDNGYAYYFS